VSDVLLLRNPTLEELVQSIEGPEGGKDTAVTSMNMNALNGFRFLVSIWIVRGHIGLSDMLQDSWNYDINQNWRGKFFMVIAGMMMTLRYDQQRVGVIRMLKENMLQLLPVYWLALLATVPLEWVPQWSHGSHSEVAVRFLARAFLVTDFLEARGLTRIQTCRSLLAQTYFMQGQLLFTICFNPIQDFVQWWLLSDGIRLGNFLVLALAAAAAFFWEPTMGENAGSGLSLFILGAVLGQACVHIKLSHVQAKIVAGATDVLAAVLAYQAFTQVGFFWLGFSSSFSPFILVIAFLIFGCCRTDCLFGRLLASPFLSFAELSYVIYICHTPIIKWFAFIIIEHVDTWRKLFTFNYAATTPPCKYCSGPTVPHDQQPPFAYLIIYLLTFFVGISLTFGFHSPCQRLINKHILAKGP
jgi:hypothetical protein